MSQIVTDQCTFIVNGAWNTAIIQPDWLRSQFPDLIPAKLDILFIPAIVSSLRFDLEKIMLEPNDNRLVFIPKKVNDDTLDYIAKLSIELKKRLPHTPISAAGCNFVFKLDEDENFSMPELEKTDELKSQYKNLGLEELTSKVIRHTFSFSDHQLNIDFSINLDNKLVRYNYHYQLSEPIETAAKSLKDNFIFSKELNEKLIRSN